MDDTEPADQAEVDQVRFLFTSGPGFPEAHEKSTIPFEDDKVVARYTADATPVGDQPFQLEPKVSRLADWQTDDRDVIGAFRWEMAVPFGEPFRSEFDAQATTPDEAFGAYFAAWYVVSVDVSACALHPEGFDLRVFSRKKERIGHFRLLPK